MRTTLRHSLARMALALLTLVVIAGAAVLVPPGRAGASSTKGDRRSTYALGAYAGANGVAGLATFESQIGAKMAYAMEFLDGTSWASISNPSYQLSHWYGAGYDMIWAVPMLPNRGASLSVGATGAYDKHFTTLARALVAAGQGSSVIRLGWEFNGIWFPWSAKGHAAQFIAYWRHIVTTMRAVPGAKFTFEWNPDRGDLGVGNLASYYPGNAYVNDVGLDVYDVEWQHYPGARAEFTHIVTGPYGLNWLASFSAAHHKPMVFPEWGLGWGTCRNGAAVSGPAGVCGGDNALFIKDSSTWFASHDVLEVSYWDYGTSSVAGTQNRLTRAALATDWAHPTRTDASRQARPTTSG